MKMYAAILYLGRESNPNLSLRRTLFYPLNYQGLRFASRRYNNYSQPSNAGIPF